MEHFERDDSFRVFFLWQSDTAYRTNRTFIRKILDNVAAAINADAAIVERVTIDQDTQGVTGLCDIPATILQKIDSCDAVVADLSYVAKREDANKPRFCSNPNVLFELGYAFRAIGSERLVCIMNEACGPREEQIFDLAHRRHPIHYKFDQEPMEKEQEERFQQNVNVAIRDIIVKLGRRSKPLPLKYFIVKCSADIYWLKSCFIHWGGTEEQWDRYVSLPPRPDTIVNFKFWDSDAWERKIYEAACFYKEVQKRE